MREAERFGNSMPWLSALGRPSSFDQIKQTREMYKGRRWSTRTWCGSNWLGMVSVKEILKNVERWR
jgi:hypothetical protein